MIFTRPDTFFTELTRYIRRIGFLASCKTKPILLQFAKSCQVFQISQKIDWQNLYSDSVYSLALKLQRNKFGTQNNKQGIPKVIHKEQGGNAFMKRNIKVIKKNTQNAGKNVSELRSNSKQKAREMVSTVANWVTDLQARKRAETKTAIENFFSAPRPSES